MSHELPAEVAVVARGDLAVTVNEEGMTRVKNRYVIASPVAGQLRRIEWKAGAVVEAGKTVLAVLDSGGADLLDTRSLAQAEARVLIGLTVQTPNLAIDQASTIANIRLNRCGGSRQLDPRKLACSRDITVDKSLPQHPDSALVIQRDKVAVRLDRDWLGIAWKLHCVRDVIEGEGKLIVVQQHNLVEI